MTLKPSEINTKNQSQKSLKRCLFFRLLMQIYKKNSLKFFFVFYDRFVLVWFYLNASLWYRCYYWTLFVSHPHAPFLSIKRKKIRNKFSRSYKMSFCTKYAFFLFILIYIMINGTNSFLNKFFFQPVVTGFLKKPQKLTKAKLKPKIFDNKF